MDCLDVFLRDPETEGLFCVAQSMCSVFFMTTMFTVKMKSEPTLLLQAIIIFLSNFMNSLCPLNI